MPPVNGDCSRVRGGSADGTRNGPVVFATSNVRATAAGGRLATGHHVSFVGRSGSRSKGGATERSESQEFCKRLVVNSPGANSLD